MAKKRNEIKMSDEDVWKFIAEQKTLQVATIGADGAPHLTALWFAIVDGDIVFETFTKSQKIMNLRRDPRIAVLVEDGVEYNDLRGVSINGRAVLHTDPVVVQPYARAVMSRNHPQMTSEQLDGASKMMASKRTAVVVKPEKIVSWDHRKLGGSY